MLIRITIRSNIIAGAIFKILSRSFYAEILAPQGFPAGLRASYFIRDKSGYPEFRNNQTFSIAGSRGGFDDPRGTLFFELARLAEARHPKYWLAENVPGLLDHDGGRTFAAILREMEKLGYFVEWQVLNSADFGVPQARKRVYLIGYLDERCRGKIFPFTEGAGAPAVQPRPAEAAAQIKCATKKGYQTARVGDSIDLSYATSNTRRGLRQTRHTVLCRPER